MTRQFVVVDLETTSLDTDICSILEVAAFNEQTGQTLRFVPYIEPQALANAEPIALSVNRYYERRLFEESLSFGPETTRAFQDLREMLRGNTLGGSNPRFDAAVLGRAIGEVWHHRLADLSAYTAGALRLPPTEMPGLEKCCELLGVTNENPHSALGDVMATVECFQAIEDMEGKS